MNQAQELTALCELQISDVMFIKDQLLNAWEHMDEKEMLKHLSSQAPRVNKSQLKKLIDDWYNNYKRRIRVTLSKEDLESWIAEYL